MRRARLALAPLLLAGALAAPDAAAAAGPEIDPAVVPGSGERLMAPILEAEQGSGDLASWTDAVTVEEPRTVRFRWKPRRADAVAAEWRIRRPGARGGAGPILRRGRVPDAPAPDAFAVFSLRPLSSTPAAPEDLRVEVVALDAQDQPLGEPSLPVVVRYRPPGEAGPIRLDALEVRGVTPPAGSVVDGGTPDEVWEMDAGNSIEIAWRWELVTAERGTIRPSLHDAEGRPVPGQFWSAKSVEGAGPGTGASRAAVRCNEANGAYEREVAAIHYTLRDGDTLLAEGKEPLAPPIRFRCAAFDMLEVLAVTPSRGTVWALDEGEPHPLFRAGRSVRVRYRYHVASVPEAVLKHGLMVDRQRPVPGNVSTLPRVSEGTGTEEVPLSRACAHPGLPDVRARFIRYRLIDPARDATLREGYHPVDLVFTCGAPRLGSGASGEILRDRRLRPGSTGRETLAPEHALDPPPSLRGEEPRLRGAPPVRRIPVPGPGSDPEEEEATDRIERPRHDPSLRP